MYKEPRRKIYEREKGTFPPTLSKYRTSYQFRYGRDCSKALGEKNKKSFFLHYIVSPAKNKTFQRMSGSGYFG